MLFYHKHLIFLNSFFNNTQCPCSKVDLTMNSCDEISHVIRYYPLSLNAPLILFVSNLITCETSNS